MDRTPTRRFTPYVGRNARLSQVWLNRWIILLMLVAGRIWIVLTGLAAKLTDAKSKALTACTRVEDVGSAIASLPHYLSSGVNSLVAASVSDAIRGLVNALDLLLTGVEQLLLFVIDMMTSTYTCLIAAAVHGGLNVSSLVISDTTESMNTALGSIASDIQSVADGADQAIASAWSLLGEIPSALRPNGLDAMPTFDLSQDINSLKNVHIDTSGFVADLVRLNEQLPTFADVQKMTASELEAPFDIIRKELQRNSQTWLVNASALPIAPKVTLGLCSNNSAINDFFSDLSSSLRTAEIVFSICIPLAAISACVTLYWWQKTHWKGPRVYQNELIEVVSRFLTSEADGTNPGGEELIEVVSPFQSSKTAATDRREIVSRLPTPESDTALPSMDPSKDYDLSQFARIPGRSRIASAIAARMSKEKNVKLLIWWTMAYGSTSVALFVLSLALAGFLSCLFQSGVLTVMDHTVPELANEAANLTERIVGTLQEESTHWAAKSDGIVQSLQDEINHNLLTHVTHATNAMNNTLNVFVDTMSDALLTTFNGTVLMEPIKEVVYCLVVLKAARVQQGLTWVHDHANLSLPRLPQDTFSQGARTAIVSDAGLSSLLSSPSSPSTDALRNAVLYVRTSLRSSLQRELWIAVILLLLYVIVMLVGILCAVVKWVQLRLAPKQHNLRGQIVKRPQQVPRNQPTRQEAPKVTSYYATIVS